LVVGQRRSWHCSPASVMLLAATAEHVAYSSACKEQCSLPTKKADARHKALHCSSDFSLSTHWLLRRAASLDAATMLQKRCRITHGQLQGLFVNNISWLIAVCNNHLVLGASSKKPELTVEEISSSVTYAPPFWRRSPFQCSIVQCHAATAQPRDSTCLCARLSRFSPKKFC